MREFGIAFSRGLQRGLRRFPASPPGDEFLVECFNLMPTEVGLVPRDELIQLLPEGQTTFYANYICFLDQNGHRWCITPDECLEFLVTDGFPEGQVNPLYDLVNMTPAPTPWWYRITCIDDPLKMLYFYPSPIGELIVSDTEPVTGFGLDIGLGIYMKALSGYMNMLGVNATYEAFLKILEEEQHTQQGNYICFNDPLGHMWCIYPNENSEVTVTDGVPVSQQYTLVDMTPATMPSWYRFVCTDDPLSVRYVYPSPQGELNVSATKPPGNGVNLGLGLQVRVPSLAGHFMLSVNTRREVVLQYVG